jgi:hypothetical protein
MPFPKTNASSIASVIKASATLGIAVGSMPPAFKNANKGKIIRLTGLSRVEPQRKMGTGHLFLENFQRHFPFFSKPNFISMRVRTYPHGSQNTHGCGMNTRLKNEPLQQNATG